MIPVKIKTSDNAKLPQYQSSGSAGADIFALIKDEITIDPGDTKLISTGLFLEIPEGYEAQIRPRSGLALKNNIIVPNSPGTIDSDYRGEVKIILTNIGTEKFKITNHMRIAQMVFNKILKGHFIETDDLNNTKRDNGGFGHTGI